MKSLDASLSSDLIWESSQDPDGSYFLNFGFDHFDPYDPTQFNGSLLAVEEFAKLFPNAKKVVLARLDGSFGHLLKKTPLYEERLEESRLSKELFCAALLSDTLHRLASYLPNEAIGIVEVSVSKKEDFALATLAFCKRRFEHLQIEFLAKPLPIEGDAKNIVSLPQDSLFDPSFYNPLFASLQDYKCIPEELLNEHWEEASRILYDSSTIGELGKRMLLGFEAAGGETKKVG